MKVTSHADVDNDLSVREALEREKQAKPNGRAHKSKEEADAPDVAENSEIWLAQKFSAEHGERLRYVETRGQWLVWSEGQWRVDETRQVPDLVRDVVARASATLKSENNKTAAKAIASSKTIRGVEQIARGHRCHAATLDQWDRDPFVLNTPAGVVDLHTGDVSPHDPSFFCSKMTTVTPAEEVPDDCTFTRFIARISGWDKELISFLQRAAGYSLTGSTREEALFFLYGHGQNGKSKLLEAMSAAVGAYHQVADMQTFIASKHEPIPTGLAKLQGARLVTASETEAGRRWAEAKIKAITGGDQIAARFMGKDFFEYRPQFKLWIAGNHKPGLRNVDKAIRRRLHLVPFTVTIPDEERDQDLSEKLRAEAPIVLRWMIDGCIEWQRIGLAPPAAVTDATDEYMQGEDAVQQWLDERCEIGPTFQATAAELWNDWRLWAESARIDPGNSNRSFPQKLKEKGFENERSRTCRFYKGLRLDRPPTGGLV